MLSHSDNFSNLKSDVFSDLFGFRFSFRFGKLKFIIHCSPLLALLQNKYTMNTNLLMSVQSLRPYRLNTESDWNFSV